MVDVCERCVCVVYVCYTCVVCLRGVCVLRELAMQALYGCDQGYGASAWNSGSATESSGTHENPLVFSAVLLSILVSSNIH